MRQSLMNSFDGIYILDLHGNSLKKEKCPDGSKDENVFDIKQGVAIALFIKKKSNPLSPLLEKGNPPPIPPLEKGGKGGFECKVYHSEIWGLRENKYDWLLGHDINTSKWQKLSPKSEFYLFIPRAEKLLEAYGKFLKVTDIFPVNVPGIVTARDRFIIDFDREVLKRRIVMFRNLSMPDELIKQTFKLKDTRGWKFTKARRELAEDQNWHEYFTTILYRPFDIRYIYYTQKMVDWPRPELMPHMMQDNLGLITARSNKSNQMNHFYCTKNIMETKCGESTTQSCLFPLYLYPAKDKKDLFSHKKGDKRQLNISPTLSTALVEVYKKELTPEWIFHYIYAVLYSNIYRTKYAGFLRIDFPRIPFTKNYKLFCKMEELGERLIDLHLLKSPELDSPIARFQGKGDNKVEKIKYGQGEVYLNNDQYFEGILLEVWQYQIGGYQVCDKWLKDRKGRILSLDDIRHYCKVVTAIKNTIEIQKEIDNLYPEIEKETIEFKNPKKE